MAIDKSSVGQVLLVGEEREGETITQFLPGFVVEILQLPHVTRPMAVCKAVLACGVPNGNVLDIPFSVALAC